MSITKQHDVRITPKFTLVLQALSLADEAGLMTMRPELGLRVHEYQLPGEWEYSSVVRGAAPVLTFHMLSRSRSRLQ